MKYYLFFASLFICVILQLTTANTLSGPKITTPPFNIKVREGADIELFCEVTGDPIPTIEWLLDGEPLKTGDSRIVQTGYYLYFYDLTREMTGVYMCIARNHFGVDSASAQITAEYASSIVYLPKKVYLNNTETGSYKTRIRCNASGSPVPFILWSYKRNIDDYRTPLSNTRDYKTVQSNDSYIASLLYANKPGMYKCEAYNTIGSDRKITIVKNSVNKTAILRITNDVIAFPGQTITLKCESVHAVRLYWIDSSTGNKLDAISGKDIGTTRTTYTSIVELTNVTRSREGDYTCVSEGESNTVKRTTKISIIENRESLIAVINSYNLCPLTEANTRQLAKFEAELKKAILHLTNPYTQTYLLEPLTITKLPSQCSQLANRLSVIITQLTECQTTTNIKLSDCSPSCLIDNYPSIDGRCNNLVNPNWGSSFQQFHRLLPAEYPDGIDVLRDKSLTGDTNLPTSITVSKEIFSLAVERQLATTNALLMHIGQFLDHDITISPTHGECKECNEKNAYCMNMNSLDEPCARFQRSKPLCGTGLSSWLNAIVRPRQQINLATSYVHLSQLYGSKEEDSMSLRSHKDPAKLRVGSSSKYKTTRDLLPFDLNNVMACLGNTGNSWRFPCFLAGDVRANEIIGLLALHTLLLREHNRLVDNLRRLNPFWSADKLFYEARKINIGQWQAIIYQQYIPGILGNHLGLLGTYRGYNDKINPAIAASFSTGAFRFGHSQIPNKFCLADEKYDKFQTLNAGDLFFSPQKFVEYGIDNILRGLISTKSGEDEIISREMRERLFDEGISKVRRNLAALNIQRARDHGVPSYSAFRRLFGLRASNATEVLSDISNTLHGKILQVYPDVESVDLFTGGILESDNYNGKVGITFAHIIADQMSRLRDGDRYYYEASDYFTANQLAEIRKTTLSRLILDNTDISKIPAALFKYQETLTSFLTQLDIPPLDFTPWKDCETESFEGCNSRLETKMLAECFTQANVTANQIVESRDPCISCNCMPNHTIMCKYTCE